MNETELAYIAGFIDGEGCLHIGKTKPRQHAKSNVYFALITITNTNPIVPRWIQSIYGGHLQKVSGNEKSKDSYTLHLRPKATYQLLKQIYPYLKLKRLQADNLFRLEELRKANPKRSLGYIYGTLPSSKEYLGLQEECYQANKGLNQRGPQ
jgi:hypothetical protein